jgi:hypothetical protein
LLLRGFIQGKMILRLGSGWGPVTDPVPTFSKNGLSVLNFPKLGLAVWAHSAP